MKRGNRISVLILALALAGCSTTSSLPEGEYLLRKADVKVNDKSFNASNLSSYVVQRPNSYLLGLNPLLSIYNWAGDSQTGFARFLRRLGTAPVVYDAAKVGESTDNMAQHLEYMGYYGSKVESDVNVKGRKVYVTYYVTLGKRYTISAIDYQIPTYGTFQEDFTADLPNTSLHQGDFLSEESLEAEADRSARYFRNKGYYGFTKGFYSFEADTLAHDGTARLKAEIRDYALGDDPSSAQPHRKYSIGKVSIDYPKDLKIRHRVLENLNLLRPGQPYSEKAINNTYTRFTNVSMLSGVNVNVTPSAEDQVDCNISLRNSGLQGFKTNLEASVNSTGLIGISPQLSYYHKNIFHGGEILNLGLKGNFQFRPSDKVSSTEVSVSTSLRFPRFIGLPNSFFKGPYIPHTDISLSFNYQNRPEFRRGVLASAFTYNGRFSERLFYQFSPIRANISRIFDISDDFLVSLVDNPYLLQLYMDRFDMGVSGMLYYTTNAATIPTTPYHYVRLSMDLAGNVLSLFNPLLPVNEDGEHLIWKTPYAQYVRAELQLGKTFRFGRQDKQSLALRFLIGAGFGYGNSSYQPLDKMFYCGGSTSMRGWQARTLGPGTSKPYTQYFVIPTQIGEAKIEANIEYRFPLFWKLEGATFIDAGNIFDFDDYPNSTFSLEGIGLDWGLGLRLNLDFILLRLDAGARVHDPARDAGDRWVHPGQWFSGSNIALHFGVGYPF
ncbi:MAG: BamA/TamA family outer membrane protein [Bacteroidales bacterium]|nr:BamA/TamA family outer membrane protein [Bacteroidales bacterium]